MDVEAKAPKCPSQRIILPANKEKHNPEIQRWKNYKTEPRVELNDDERGS